MMRERREEQHAALGTRRSVRRPAIARSVIGSKWESAGRRRAPDYPLPDSTRPERQCDQQLLHPAGRLVLSCVAALLRAISRKSHPVPVAFAPVRPVPAPRTLTPHSGCSHTVPSTSSLCIVQTLYQVVVITLLIKGESETRLSPQATHRHCRHHSSCRHDEVRISFTLVSPRKGKDMSQRKRDEEDEEERMGLACNSNFPTSPTRKGTGTRVSITT